jgi:oligoribonuclease
MLGIFLDIETNGLNTKRHKAIEIAFKLLNVLTGQDQEAFQTIIFQPFEEWKRSDPVSLGINGFTWNDIKEGMKIEKVTEEIKAIFKRNDIERKKAVFICQNPSFDRAFFNQIIDIDVQEKLNWPYHWLDLASMYWIDCLKKGRTLPWDTGLSKDQIAHAFNLPPEQTPHKAMNGVDHLILCYEAVVGFPQRTQLK